jgi:putative nucleotidyltransferase with HDIG domain
VTTTSLAGDQLKAAQQLERAGETEAALEAYAAVRALATEQEDRAVLVRALRHLSVLHHHRTERDQAVALAEEALALAREADDEVLQAEVLNTIAGFALERGDLDGARASFLTARDLAGASPNLNARIEQNLGILANVRGDHEAAAGHYTRSLAGYRQVGDEVGSAIAYHNLGMVHADRGQWDEADGYFRRTLEIARHVGDVHLQGLGLLNYAEVHLARQHYERAREDVEAALGIFDRLDARIDKADAYRMLGTVFRETGRHTLAESRLTDARELAVSVGSVLSEAEAVRELAKLYRDLGRNQESLTAFNRAHRLFNRLDARIDLVDVGAKIADLEQTYMRVVHEWGQSLESADSYTYGHCDRVADYGLAVSAGLGFDADARKTLQLGAYLHDIGKVRIPHEILNKPGRLTEAEFGVIQRHPEWGLELLQEVEFPWDIKPIIRSHHERLDGTGYPDKLAGDGIPLQAQVICIVDVYDALTTARSYKPAFSKPDALARMGESRHWWRTEVYEAFMDTVGRDG